MQTFLILLFELTLLFFLSKSLQKGVFTLLYFLTRSQHVSLTTLTFLYLPGTVIHEFAHLISAEILRVTTGELSFTPRVNHKGHNSFEVELGHVEVAKTDPFRNFLIAFAPLFAGMGFLLLLLWIFNFYEPQIIDLKLKIGFIALIAYLIYSISNNMFSSKKDLEGVILFIPVLIILIAAFYFAGIRINLAGNALIAANTLGLTLTRSLGIVVGINLVILLVNNLILRTLLKLNGKKMV